MIPVRECIEGLVLTTDYHVGTVPIDFFAWGQGITIAAAADWWTQDWGNTDEIIIKISDEPDKRGTVYRLDVQGTIGRIEPPDDEDDREIIRRARARIDLNRDTYLKAVDELARATPDVMWLDAWREAIEARPKLDPMKVAFPQRDILTVDVVDSDGKVVDVAVFGADGSGVSARGTEHGNAITRLWAYEQLSGLELDELVERLPQMDRPGGLSAVNPRRSTASGPLLRVANMAMSGKLESD